VTPSAATIRHVSRATALIDEIANELDTWPGVHIERRSEAVAVVRYEQLELGVLDRDHGVVQLHLALPEREELVEHGDAEPAESVAGVRHFVEGPSDVTAVLAIFDRRYRDVRGEDQPFSSQDSA
jgi:hypothetical protein